MCITFSLTSKPCIGVCNGSLQFPKSMVTTARTEVITAPKRPNTFPGLTKQGLSDTDLRVQEVVRRQSWSHSLVTEVNCRKSRFEPMFVDDAYDMCRNICAEYAKTFYLGPNNFYIERFCFFLMGSSFEYVYLHLFPT